MGELARQILYKAKWHDVEVRMVDRFFPSFKTCSGCGNVKPELNLNERIYYCTNCELVIDRDLNAAINLARWQPKESLAKVKPPPTRELLFSKT
ncbi:MAG TPA: zinc ribbon domain-containing protein [Acidimicrobiales bacterium]